MLNQYTINLHQVRTIRDTGHGLLLTFEITESRSHTVLLQDEDEKQFAQFLTDSRYFYDLRPQDVETVIVEED